MMSPEEEYEYRNMALQAQNDKSNLAQLQMQQAQTMFQGNENDNLIKWQLDIKDELERIEHLLRGDTPEMDSEGNVFWARPKDPEDQLFNEKGVREIMKIISWYLNKNIILSNFNEKQIDLRMKQFSETVTNLIFVNYEKWGWDNKEKIKHYEMIVLNLVNTVEAAYYRAWRGGERESLRKTMTVAQTDPINRNMYPGQAAMMPKRRFSLLRPTTWFRR